ncbi:hypothetical protein [Luteolibacter marinus]|uniref:hypothetical protein n=1 Tax=Luteolibacter marinus TaxID=2776705 RepID=UPI001869332E|nr:hypothetical protein [Luteolibacter marinus]
MITNLPLRTELPGPSPEESSRFLKTDFLGLHNEFADNSRKLENRRRHRASSERPGLWTGSKDGLVATIIVVVASLAFGGAGGLWFAADESGWLAQGLRIAGGSIVMASLVTLSGSLVSGRNAIFWGIGMPLLVYAAGSFCAFMTAGAGASPFLFGAPLFSGLAILAGVMTAFAIDRGR